MNVSVREAGPFERLVGFELTDDEIDAAKAAAAKRLAKDLKLKGFRPGKAPRPVVEAAVGKSRLRSEAIEDAIPPKLTEVLMTESLQPAVNPELEKVEEVVGGVAVEVKVTLWPKLDQAPPYRDRRIEIDSPEVTEEELDSQMERMREQFGQVEEVERPAAEGDFVSVDVAASVEDEEIEEGTATELLYRIGSDGLVEGADEALVGTSAGDVVTIHSPLPDAIGDQAGQEATFTITVNEVKELILPALDDDWVDENTEYETVEEMRENLRQRIAEAKRSGLGRRFSDRALETLLSQVEVEIPEAVIRAEMDDLLHRFIHRLEDQGLSIEDYFSMTGMTQEQLVQDVAAQAHRSLRTRLLLDAVVEDAGIELDESEVDSVLHSAASQSGDAMAFLEAFRGTPQELALRGDMLRNKALELIIENATPVDPDGNVIELPTEDEEEVVAGEVVEGEIIEGEIVEGEIVPEESLPDAHDEENE